MACPLAKLCWNLKDDEKINIPHQITGIPHCSKIQHMAEDAEIEHRQTIGFVFSDWATFARGIAAYYGEENAECRALLEDLLAAEAIKHCLPNFRNELKEKGMARAVPRSQR